MAGADAALYRSKHEGRDRVSAAHEAEVPAPGTNHPLDEPAPSQVGTVQILPEEPPGGRWLAWRGFAPDMERTFRSQATKKGLRAIVLSGGPGILVFNLFLAVDLLMVPDVIPLAALMRLCVFTPVMLLAMWLAGPLRRRLLAVLSTTASDALLATALLVASVCLGVILSQSQSELRVFYNAGFMVIIMYGTVVQRMRMNWTLGTLLGVYLINVASMATLPDAGSRSFWGVVLLTSGTLIMTLRASHALENEARVRFWHSWRSRVLRQALERARRQLEIMTHEDPLTGLHNRRHFLGDLERCWQRLAHGNGELAILMVDVDHFKQYNDHLGHPAGDQCLIKVANAMQACLRGPEDMLARYGGEEFIAALPGAGPDAAQAAAERLRQAVEALGLGHATSPTSHAVTVSIGVACARIDASSTIEAMIAGADTALYEAKRAGRNRVACT
jgi:diguanylate cyclase (GGDEF)-like protein